MMVNAKHPKMRIDILFFMGGVVKLNVEKISE
jgi:hypothetical protein